MNPKQKTLATLPAALSGVGRISAWTWESE
jgi:hypothetical protein